ncbi:MAG: hypothetical protein HY420_04670 [Candidatus Kerfeldbacteria bacterium]|nr:hypothetical protein [Candidatus Kerfeldbacteria bacterium]
MKPLLLTFIITVVLFGFIQPELVHACSCIPPRSVSEEFQLAGAVFSGTVTNVSQTSRSSSSGSLAGSLGKKVSLAVERSWKGVTTATVTIETGIGGGDCGFNFEEGKSYLVYTEGSSQRSANVCSNTKELAAASDDLRQLGPARTSFTNSSFPANAQGISFRTIAGLGTAIVISLALLWLAKRWDRKNPLT